MVAWAAEAMTWVAWEEVAVTSVAVIWAAWEVVETCAVTWVPECKVDLVH